MQGTAKIKPEDSFYSIDKTPFDFKSIGGRRRFNINSTYEGMLTRGAYVLIVPRYDKTTHEQDGSMVFNVDHFDTGVVKIRTRSRLDHNTDQRRKRRECFNSQEYRSMQGKEQRGEIELQILIDRAAEIRAEFPYREES